MSPHRLLAQLVTASDPRPRFLSLHTPRCFYSLLFRDSTLYHTTHDTRAPHRTLVSRNTTGLSIHRIWLRKESSHGRVVRRARCRRPRFQRSRSRIDLGFPSSKVEHRPFFSSVCSRRSSASAAEGRPPPRKLACVLAACSRFLRTSMTAMMNFCFTLRTSPRDAPLATNWSTSCKIEPATKSSTLVSSCPSNGRMRSFAICVSSFRKEAKVASILRGEILAGVLNPDMIPLVGENMRLGESMLLRNPFLLLFGTGCSSSSPVWTGGGAVRGATRGEESIAAVICQRWKAQRAALVALRQ